MGETLLQWRKVDDKMIEQMLMVLLSEIFVKRFQHSLPIIKYNFVVSTTFVISYADAY